MQLVVCAFLLVAAYRFCFVLERKGAAIWGALTALVLTGVTWLFMPGQLRPIHVLGIAVVEIAVLVPSFYLCVRREGFVVTVLNMAVGSAAALALPYFVPGWLATV